MSIETQARAWLAEDPDPETRAELEALIAAGGDELAARFAGRLEFGTAGIRGVLGAGPMCMNRVVVRRVSAGLADYVLETIEGARERGIVVCYDGRFKSREFAEDAARVFRGKGLRVWLGTEVLPTPTAAFAVTDRGAAAGVMVTASHNPPAYNGYKVYWENGAQIIPPHDRGISAAIDRVGRTDELAMPELDAEPLGDDVSRRYLDGVRALAVHPDVDKTGLVLAYTPLHGVGAKLAERALAEAGFTAVHTVASQREPDGAFPTVTFPNPEEQGAMDAVLALAREVGAHAVFANDPDADRLAVALPQDGGYRMLTGDQIGVLLADYLLSEGDASGARMVATTIVSSQLLEAMAKGYGADYRETLTGFKWIANAAIDYGAGGGRFVIGYEEALGYSVGELVRDKDGISAIASFAEMVAFDRAHGRSVWQRLEAIYRRFGLYATRQESLVLPGVGGLARIGAIMERFRAAPPAEIGGHEVVQRHDIAKGELGLPKSNVLVFRLAGNRRVIMRPSGTEPKLKSYYEVCEPVADGETVEVAAARAGEQLEALRIAHQATLTAIV